MQDCCGSLQQSYFFADTAVYKAVQMQADQLQAVQMQADQL